MGIKREAVDRQQIDYSDVSTGGRLPPVHPGEILRDEFLKPMNLIRASPIPECVSASAERYRARTPRRHDRYRAASRALLRHDA